MEPSSREPFDLHKLLIPIASVTEKFLVACESAKLSAQLDGNQKDLASYTFINIDHIYRIFFDYADIKNDVDVFAALTRGAQELLADYLYAVNHKNRKQKVQKLLEVRRFGAHSQQEYFMYVKGEITEEKMCEAPKWTDTNYEQRIYNFGGFEEQAFYDVLCSYTHQSVPNHRLIEHPNEIFLLRSYFLGKVLKYFNLLVESIVNAGGLSNAKFDNAAKTYLMNISKQLKSWDSMFPNLYEFTDHDGRMTDSRGSNKQ